MKQMLGVFIWLAFGCSSPSDNYPEIITKMQKQRQYDLAKIEMYKLNSCCNCRCNGIIYYAGDIPNDTVSILSANIVLDTLIMQSDTVLYCFSFYDSVYKNQVNIQTYLPTNCPYYFAVGYIEESTKPFKAIITENTHAFYGAELSSTRLDSTLKICLDNKEIKINAWLLRFLKKNPNLLN